MKSFSPIRAAVVMSLVVVCLLSLLGRVAYLQTYGRQAMIRRAERQQHQYETLRSRRGSIFDSAGLLFAGTVQTMSLFIDPTFLQEQLDEQGVGVAERDRLIQQLARLIEKDAIELAQLLNDKSEARFVRVADHIDEQTRDAIDKMKLPGVGFMPVNVRNYPMGSIAAHVLGGVGSEGKGLEGLELKFEKLLAGKDGYKRAMKDARRRPIAVNAEDYLPPINGQHLVLTIDSNIQMIAEQELAARCNEYGAKRGEVVVMDPQTGDVLALANWPTFDPQNLIDTTKDLRRNRVLTDPYEPGSTIKPFIVGPALAMKLTTPGEVFPVHGKTYKSPLRRPVVSDVYGYGPLTTWDILVKSSNVGMTMLGERMGKANLRQALIGFRFGQPTGIELPGEDPGLIKRVTQIKNADIVSMVQGYALMVTPLQLARGMCAFANGGRLVQPRLIKGVLDADGGIVSRTPEYALKMLPEVLDPYTATQMRRILADVPMRGTAAAHARSKVWNMFGKTGTAHISQDTGGYDEQNYTSSFIGGAPYENPKLVIAVVIHEPDKSKGHHGGAVAAPAAMHTLERCLAYLQIPASPPLAPPPPQIANLLHNYDPKLYARPAVTTSR